MKCCRGLSLRVASISVNDFSGMSFVGTLSSTLTISLNEFHNAAGGEQPAVCQVHWKYKQQGATSDESINTQPFIFSNVFH